MSRQSYNITSKQVRIDSDWHKYAKFFALANGKSLKQVIEEGLAEVISVDFIKNIDKK